MVTKCDLCGHPARFVGRPRLGTPEGVTLICTRCPFASHYWHARDKDDDGAWIRAAIEEKCQDRCEFLTTATTP